MSKEQDRQSPFSALNCNNSYMFYFVAFEFLDDFSMSVVETQLGLHNPISKQPFYVLVETYGSDGNHDQQVLFSIV